MGLALLVYGLKKYLPREEDEGTWLGFWVFAKEDALVGVDVLIIFCHHDKIHGEVSLEQGRVVLSQSFRP